MNSLQPESRLRTVIVVPCFNEAERLDVECFASFAAWHPGFSFLFVNDGSTDGTSGILKNLQRQHGDWCELLDLDANLGKAEAVRRGVMWAYASRPDAIGYLDADLATPLDALPRLLDALNQGSQRHLVMGSRLRLQGHRIERKRIRGLLGRAFAVVASWTLGLAIVDTQCGAKLFRTAPQIEALFATPFRSRWIFDVEILARMCQHLGREQAAQQLYELPLESWREVPGSKLRTADFFRAVGELTGNFWHYRLRPRLIRRTRSISSFPQAVSSRSAAHDDPERFRRAA